MFSFSYYSLTNLKEGIYIFLTKPKVVKISAIATSLTFFPGIIIAVIVASSQVGGYNILENYISNLGSINHTPAPYIFNFTCMISAVLLLPATIYLFKILVPGPQNIESDSKSSKKGYRLGLMGYIFMLLGLVGLFLIGIFNEAYLLLHIVFAAFAFGGIMIAGVLYGLVIVLYPTIIPKVLGIFMIIAPILMGLFTGLKLFPSRAFWEWMSLLTVIGWLLPINYYIIKQI